MEVGGDRRVGDLVEEEFELIERRFLVGGDSWWGGHLWSRNSDSLDPEQVSYTGTSCFFLALPKLPRNHFKTISWTRKISPKKTFHKNISG